MHDHDDPNNPLGSTRQTPEGVPIIDGPDGLAELDNPMPRWMTNVFWLTIVWSAGYLVLYPGVGLSALGWTQKGMYDAEMAEAKTRYRVAAPAAGGGDTLAAAMKDPEAAKRGGATFQAQCAACHGQQGKGAIGPDLTDTTWLYGGKGAEIAHTIAAGTAKGMPPFKASLSATQLADLAVFVHGMGGGKPE